MAINRISNYRSILKEEVKFKPADPSTLKNPEEDMMRELEKKGEITHSILERWYLTFPCTLDVSKELRVDITTVLKMLFLELCISC